MQIVPVDDSLVIEAKMKTADFGFMRLKLPATVKLDAYDAEKLGHVWNQGEDARQWLGWAPGGGTAVPGLASGGGPPGAPGVATPPGANRLGVPLRGPGTSTCADDLAGV